MPGAMPGSERISPTANVTGYVWVRHGLAPEAFATSSGRVLHGLLQPFTLAGGLLLRSPSLDTVLLQRHLAIDHVLRGAIESGRVGQVLEIAAGYSPRGLRFMREHGEAGLVYVEGDLPDMVERKRRLLETAVGSVSGLHVVPVDALDERGPHSLERATEGLLDPAVGTAVVTEGLLSYLPPDAVKVLWRRIASLLSGFPRGLYVSNLYMGGEVGHVTAARLFRPLVAAFSRGPVYLHFDSAIEAVGTLEEVGFGAVDLHIAADLLPRRPGARPVERRLTRVIEAWTER
jgi:O-methyltransferase involved in polyketide biosynthesis